MANIKSAKKRAQQNEERQLRNKARKSEIKTVTKKFQAALEAGQVDQAQELMKLAESKIARAKGKKVLKPNTAARKISRLARQLAAKVAGV